MATGARTYFGRTTELVESRIQSCTNKTDLQIKNDIEEEERRWDPKVNAAQSAAVTQRTVCGQAADLIELSSDEALAFLVDCAKIPVFRRLEVL